MNSFLFFFAQSIGSLWQAVKRRFRQWTKPVDNALVLGTILAVTRSKSELVLIVPGLIARQATVGGVTIGGDRNPLMASEGMVFVTENMPLMPPQLSKDAGFVNDLREAAHEGDVETIIAWLFLMLQWWMPTCLIGTIFAFAELVPRLFVFHPIVLAVLWAAVASVLSWGVWWVKRKSAPICQTETSLGRCEAEK